MLVTCEKCQSKFNLDDDLVKESGTKVRCSATVEEVSPDLDFEEKAEAAEISDELAEEEQEPLDFDLFESEEDQEDEDLSLEDFGLEEEPTSEDEAKGSSEEVVAGEEEITAEELGFGEGDETLQAEEPLHEETASEESGQEELLLADLDSEEVPSVEDTLSPTDEEVTDDAAVEDEISFDDLALEEEPVDENVTGLDEQQNADRAEAEEDLSFEDLDLEEAVVEETAGTEVQSAVEQEALTFDEVDFEDEVSGEDLSEQMVAEVQPSEAFEDTESPLPEGVPVASLEERDEPVAEAMEETPPASMIDQPATKKGVSLPLMICLVVVLLGGGAFAAFNFLKGDTMKLPFLESLAGPGKAESVDPGNMNISLLDDGITGGFVENKSTGRLFVIKGKVKSGYPDARNFIRLKGVLYFKDGKVARDRIVYCGNVLSETELQALGMDAITKKLNNRFGDKKANFRVPAGKELPFMVVFNKLPENLGEFSVEVVDSIPG
jgi:hypothetical protein